MKIFEFSCIHDIKDLWNKLYYRNDSLSFYQSYDWNLILENSFKKNRNKFIKYIVLDNKIIFPLIIDTKGKQVQLLGYDASSDYLSPIFDVSVSDDFLLYSIDEIKSLYQPFLLKFFKISYKNRINAILLRMCEDNSAKYFLSSCVIVDLKEKKNEHFSKYLSKGVRQNYRTAINRINRDGLNFEINYSFEIFSNVKKNELLSLYVRRRQHCAENDLFKKMLRFIKQAIKRIIKYKKVDVLSEYSLINKTFLSTISINNQLAAFIEGNYNNDGSLSISRVAVNDDFGWYSPGHILLVETINHLKDKIDIFDLTRGTEDYKFKLGGEIVNNYNFML